MGMGLAAVVTVAALAGAPAAVSMGAVQQADAEAQAENALITQAQTAMNAKDWQAAETPLQKLVAMDPGHWEYRQNLGNTQFHLGKYLDAAQSYETAIAAAQQAGAGKNQSALGTMWTNEGNAYIKLQRNADAVAAYSKAAQVDPHPAIAWFNLCATQYNTGQMDGAVQACDKAIAADPYKADAYFIKGSVLFGNATLDANNKPAVPAGTVEALRMYLKLAPTGAHATDVQQMLDYLK